jgi:hypothetical protein
MAKILKTHELGKHIKKLQGGKTDVDFAQELDISRPSLRALKSGTYLPRATVLSKLKLEQLYRVLGADPIPAKIVKATERAVKKAK